MDYSQAPEQASNNRSSSHVPREHNLSTKSSAHDLMMPRQRSRGQIARHDSITRGIDSRAHQKKSHTRRSSATPRTSTSPSLPRTSSYTTHQRPWLGGLFFTDIIFIAFTYLVNLLRTCGFAELADVAVKGLVYTLFSLPIEMYRRWTLSTPPGRSDYQARHKAARIRRRKKRYNQRQSNRSSLSALDDSESEEDHPIFASSTSRSTGNDVEKLSPFHHFVILLSKFACGNFPHLLPRVLFAEETIGPFVYWRTGGGSNAMVQEFSNLNERKVPILTVDGSGTAIRSAETSGKQPDFRAYLMSKDARLPLEVQRSTLASQRATTLLYLHGGGFSLGSVAFYAEALLRLRAKIARIENNDVNPSSETHTSFAEARCVAVEYDLSPSTRFPTPLLQCLRCYAHLIEVEQIHPENICIAGDSAGGNLAMAMLLCLDGQAQDDELPELAERNWSQLPMPGKAVLISPWVDLRPSKAHAFASIREKENVAAHKKDTESNRKRKPYSWAEVVAEYEWDFIASEALLHFAQVYTGVLPFPRRVYGPIGWIAHVLAALSVTSDESNDSKNGFISAKGTSPTLAMLTNPSRKLVRTLHDMLNDPFLSKVTGSGMVEKHSNNAATSSKILTGHQRSGIEPLFSAEDRQTVLVNNKNSLHEPIHGPMSASPAQKVGIDSEATDAQIRGRQLLEKHPLLNPAIGDWSRIKLKHGCLVTWGEREKMAADIEAWVDSITEIPAVSSQSGDLPVQDSQLNDSIEGSCTHSSIDTKPEREKRPSTQADVGPDWLFTAVEKGPSGVHAWPFVSMYLAGSEKERERGLDLLADFIARRSDGGQHSHEIVPKPDKSHLTPLSIEVPDLKVLDLPHAAPDSPESGSAGSMPSDVDLHGLVDDPHSTHLDAWRSPHHHFVSISHAVQRARDLGYDTKNSPFGSPQSRQSHPLSSPNTPGVSEHYIKKPRDDHFIQAISRGEHERGRSRSPRRHINFSQPVSSPANVSSTSGTHSSKQSSSTQQPQDYFVSHVPLHHPKDVSPYGPLPSRTMPMQDQSPQGKISLLWTANDNSEAHGFRQNKNSVQQAATTIGMQPSSDHSSVIESNRGVEISDDTMSPSSSRAKSSREILSEGRPGTFIPSDFVPSSDGEVSENDFGEAAEEEGLSPYDEQHDNYSGLSQWSIQRPEPEGLSDIAEEGSVLSASLTSNGDSRSRSLSPVGADVATHMQNLQSHSLLEAATNFMKDHRSQSKYDTDTESSSPQRNRQWRYLRDENSSSAMGTCEDESDEGDVSDFDYSTSEREQRSDMTAVPILYPHQSSSGQQQHSPACGIKTSPTQPSASNTSRVQSASRLTNTQKKPKGDVWW